MKINSASRGSGKFFLIVGAIILVVFFLVTLPLHSIKVLPPLTEKLERIPGISQIYEHISKRSPVRAVAFSPDGRIVASGSDDNAITLWDVSSGRQLRILKDHKERVNAISFSPDGRILASGSDDRTIRLWDLSTDFSPRVIGDHHQAILSVFFSPDGKILVSGTSDGTFYLWNVADGSRRLILEDSNNKAGIVAFSPDSKLLAITSTDKTIGLWDIDSGAQIKILKGNTAEVSSVSFSPQGHKLASAAYDGAIILWDVQNGRQLKRLEGNRERVNAIIFSPDGQTLATGAVDRSIRLWDIGTGRQVFTLAGHKDEVSSLDFSPDGRLLVSGSLDKTIRLWNVSVGERVRVMQGHIEPVETLALSLDGKFLAAGSGSSGIRIWDTQRGQLMQILNDYNGRVTSLSFSPDRKILAGGSTDTNIYLWDMETERQLSVLIGHSNAVNSVTFSPDGTMLASGSSDNTIILWSVDNRQKLKTLKGHTNAVLSVRFSPDGTKLVSGSKDKTLRLWSVDGAKKPIIFKGHLDDVWVVDFSPDGRTLASGSFDNTVRLWDAAKGEQINLLEGHRSYVMSIRFSRDGRLLVSASDDNTVRLWNVQSGDQLNKLEGHTNTITSVSISRDNRVLVSGSLDGTVRLWDLEKIRQSNETQEKKSGILIGGQNGTWLSAGSDGAILRGDDGTLLMIKDSSGRLAPILPVVPHPGGRLEIIKKPAMLDTWDGKSTSFTIEIKNTGNSPVYQCNISHDLKQENRPLPVFTPPPRIIKIMPGEQRALECGVSVPTPYKNPRGGQTTLLLEIKTAFLNGLPLEIPIRYHVTQLEWQKAELQVKPNPILLLTLKNNSEQDLATGIEFSGKLDSYTLDKIVRERIQANGTFSLTYSIPVEQKVGKESRIILTAGARNHPVHIWKFDKSPTGYLTRAWYWDILYVLLALLLLLGIYYLLVYTHPLTIRLSKSPEALLQLPSGQLTKARRLLRLSGRLESVVTQLEVPKSRLNNAISFYTEWSHHQQSAYLANLLDSECNQLPDNYDNAYRIHLNREIILNMKQCLLLLPEPGLSISEIVKRAKQAGEKNLTTLIFVNDEGQQEELRKISLQEDNMLVVPNTGEMNRLLFSSRPMETFVHLISSQVKVGHISPYHTQRGVEKESAFFGRSRILADITQRDLTNYFLMGARFIGKSSLLKAVKRRFDTSHNDIDSHYITLHGSKDIAGLLAHNLGLPIDTSLEQLGIFLRKVPKRLFLLDETDLFIKAEHEQGFPSLNLFRSLSEEGACYFIFAGYWELYKAIYFDYHSPIKNFGEPIRLEALEEDACFRLATEPMKLLGVDYQSADIVEKLIQETGQRADLIALVCDYVLKALQLGNRTINEAYVENALNSSDIRSLLGNFGNMTGDEDLDRLDRIIVYITVDRESFSLDDVIKLLNQNDCNYKNKQVQDALSRLEMAYILKREKENYTYCVPLFKKFILENSPSEQLEEELGY